MIYRQIIAVSSLISGLVATYLHLWKIGKVGTLACGIETHGCEFVMTSVYSYFLGYDVAFIGAVGYAAIFVVATIAGLDRFANAKWPTIALMALIWPAVLFTVRLKYGEWFVLGGFCTWCLVSLVTITLCAVLVTLDWKRIRA